MSFGEQTTTDELLAGVDLSGKHMLVTGANCGLGFETARALAAAGATVIATARNDATAAAMLEGLRQAVPAGRFESAVLALDSLAGVRACAQDILRRFPRLDVLINNAGVMNTPFGRTEDGFETQFGVDHLGPFLFTCLLVPALLAAAPARVVNLSSAAHLAGDIRWDDINWERSEYNKFMAYAQAKTANILFAVALDRRLAGRGVRAYAVHPGAINTSLGRYMSREDFDEMMGNVRTRSGTAPDDDNPWAGLTFKTVPQGAATSVWAATTPELDGRGGLYLLDCQVGKPDSGRGDGVKSYAVDPEAAERLWHVSERMVGQVFTLC